MLTNKIDFSVVISVTGANPNGDPLNENMPRQLFDGYGIISDVCIKRKIRNRLQDMGEKIFVQSDERCDDSFTCLSDRFSGNSVIKSCKTASEIYKAACSEWVDVRSFGQLFAFKSKSGKKKSDDDNSGSCSIGVRGPVSIRFAKSIDPITVETIQITKSVNSENNDGKKSSDTMGKKHFIPFMLYVFHGSINCQLAEKTGFTDEDADKIREAICTLFENDESSARPSGSMEVERVYWYKHNAKYPKTSSSVIHNALKVRAKDGVNCPNSIDDYVITTGEFEDVVIEVF